MRRNGSGDILYGGGHEYADMQVEVTYAHGDRWLGPKPKAAVQALPETFAKLSAGKPLTVALFGDSISTGCNSSKAMNTAPQLPGYGERLVAMLESASGSQVVFHNLSVGGMTSTWGVQNSKGVADRKPDLCILAWGMNDQNAPGLAPAAFAGNLKQQMASVKAANPKAEFILVSGMLPNEEWQLVIPGRLAAYREAMRSLCTNGVALADVTGVWEQLLKRKTYLDITGNGVNHPNDFGHDLYAQVIGALLLK
ncbi:MAG: SGNH/GDSL hydrolase family protein [bacterium]